MSDFYISAKVEPQLGDVQSKLNEKVFKISAEVDSSTLDKANQKISSSTQGAQRSLDNLNTATVRVNKSLDKHGNVIKTTVTSTNKLKNAIETTKTSYDKSGKVISSTTIATNKFANAEEAVGVGAVKLESGLTRIKNNIKGIGEDFISTTGKVAKFGLSTALIGAFTSAMSEAKEAVVEFDSALTEYKKVSDLSDEELQDYTKHLGELGTEVARTRTEMVSGATEFKKSGFTDEESAQLAKISAMYQNISDEEISASESAGVLISQMKAFDIQAEDTTKIIDSINEVSNSYAVSSADIGKGLTVAGSALSTYGNEFQETIGLLTAG